MPDQPWEPDQYQRFAAERAQPFHDLLALVRAGSLVGGAAVDLGCGSGELTDLAARRCSLHSMLGIDSSRAMLERAVPLQRDGLELQFGDIGTWTHEPTFDLVLANASLQWVADHRVVLGRWTAALRSGGQLAVQVPDNSGQQSHRCAVEVAARPEFAEAFGAAGPPPDPVAANVLAPEVYATLLHELGYVEQHVRLQVYPHLLTRSRDVVEWVRGTTLTRFRSVLTDEVFARFLDQYAELLLRRIGEHEPYLFPFRRILLWGRLP